MSERNGEAASQDGQHTQQSDRATHAFIAHRNLLFTVAYEMLGSAADAEDVLQATWLRWAKVDLASVENHRAYLVCMVTRQALTRLRTIRRRKESYIGLWLPEPLLTTPEVSDDAALAESLSMAMMLALETLRPTERVVFVLRDAFDLGYDKIAEVVEKSEAAVRQIAHRARTQIAARRPRSIVSAAETRQTLEAFQVAIDTGNLAGLLEILAPGVVFLADGGGIAPAALEPVFGADQVAPVLHRIPREALELAEVNGQPGLIVRLDGRIDTVIAVTIADGLITGLYAVRNPEKLSHLAHELEGRRPPRAAAPAGSSGQARG